MNRIERVSPTRMNLLRTLRSLARIQHGVALLRRKREALVSEFFRRARPAAESRSRIARQARRAYAALLRALALHSHAGIVARGRPVRELVLDLHPSQVWGLPISEVVEAPVIRRNLDARGTAPGSTGPAVVEAAKEFESLLTLLVDSAPEEMVLRRLGDELARTSRQVNALEHRLAPAIRAQVRGIRSVLEEREREEHVRARLLSRRI